MEIHERRSELHDDTMDVSTSSHQCYCVADGTREARKLLRFMNRCIYAYVYHV